MHYSIMATLMVEGKTLKDLANSNRIGSASHYSYHPISASHNLYKKIKKLFTTIVVQENCCFL